MEKEVTLKRSLLYSILIFNFYIPLFLIGTTFFNAKHSLFDGGVLRGGTSKTCQSADYDPRVGGYTCEGGEEYIYEPARYLSFSEAMAEDLSEIKNVAPFTILLGIGFGFYYHKSNRSKINS